jgi:hypothetical protein
MTTVQITLGRGTMRNLFPVAVLVTATLALVLFLGGRGPDSSWAQLWSALQEGQELEETREALCRFQEELQQAKDAVLDGSLTLPEAADQVAEAARQDYPNFLSGLQLTYPDLPPRERVMRCLLAHIEAEEQTGGGLPSQGRRPEGPRWE